MPKKSQDPFCIHCVHFILRQGSSMPYRCKLWGIQTNGRQLPSRAVFNSTRKQCPYFDKKNLSEENQTKPSKQEFSQGIDFEV